VEKKVKTMAMVHLITGVANVALSFPLSKVFGVTGACVSICTAYFIRDILLHFLYRRELGLDIRAFMKVCYGRSAAPILLTLLCGAVMNRFVPDAGWMMLVLKGLVVVAVYLLATGLFVLKKDERKVILSRLNRSRVEKA